MSYGSPQSGELVAERFTLLQRVALSGAPDAWHARQLKPELDVLLFIYPRDRFSSQGVVRLLTEGPFLQEVEDPRLVPLREVGVDARGNAFAVSPWLTAEGLVARMERATNTSPQVSAGVVVDLLGALAALHARNLAHQSLTPADVVLVTGEDGRPHARLLLGGMLSAIARPRSPETCEGRAFALDARYLSPEQLRGDPGTAESDVWAAGVILYQLLSGARPYAGDLAREVSAEIAKGPPPSLEGMASESLLRVLARALEPRAAGRYVDAERMRAALENTPEVRDGGGARPSRRPTTSSLPSGAHVVHDIVEVVSVPPRRSTPAPAVTASKSPPSIAREAVVAPPIPPPPAMPAMPSVDDDMDLDALIADVRGNAPPPEPDPFDIVPFDAPVAPALAPVPPPPPAVAAPVEAPAPPPPAPPPPAPPPPAIVLPPPAAVQPPPADDMSFNLDSVPAPPLPPPVAQPAWPPAAPPVVRARDSQMHTALSPEIIDRTSMPVVRRKRPLSTAAALLAVLAVSGGLGYVAWNFVIPSVRHPTRIDHDLIGDLPPPHPSVAARPSGDGASAPVDAAVREEPPVPRPEMQTPAEFGEQLRVPLPAGLEGNTLSTFIAHVTTAPVHEPAARGFASCVEGRVFLHPGGVAGVLREARVPARCDGQDLALVADLDGDRAVDAVAVDVRRTTLLVVGSRGMRVTKRVSLAGATAIASGLTMTERNRAEPAVVVFVSPEGGPTTLSLVGLRSGHTAWNSGARFVPADPHDYGLAVGGSVDGDPTPDIAVGLVRDGQRCVTVVSGATGVPVWTQPRCVPGAAPQSVSFGPDTDEDGVPDLAVGCGADATVRVLSGRDGRELRRVTPEGNADRTLFGTGAVLAPDLSRDGFADVVVTRGTVPTASVEVYSANDGHRVGVRAVSSDGVTVPSSQVRVQYAASFAFEGGASLVVAAPQGITVVGAAVRPEPGHTPTAP